MMLSNWLRPFLRFVTFTIFSLVVVLTWLRLTQKQEESTPTSAIQHGDILLIDGCSARSSIVRLLQFNRSQFSHVGIACIESDGVYVIHADPSLGCVKERLSDLLATARVQTVVAYRSDAEPPLIANAVLQASTFIERHIPFDHDFDSQDPSRLYCTELVCRAYSEAGINLCPPLKRVIYPDDLLSFPALKRATPNPSPNKKLLATDGASEFSVIRKRQTRPICARA